MAPGQMTTEKHFHMGLVNPSRTDALLREPSPKVGYDSAIQAYGVGVIPATAQIASEGFGNYVNLKARLLSTNSGTPASLLVHRKA